MESTTTLRIGDWRVYPRTGEIDRGGESARLEARALRLLLCLAERPGEIWSIDELLDRVWSGVAVSPDSVYQAVTSLRRILGDDPKQPVYIATVPRLGYRMVAAVTAESGAQADLGLVASNPSVAEVAGADLMASAASPPESTPSAEARPTAGRFLKSGFMLAAAVAMCLLLAVALLTHRSPGLDRESASGQDKAREAAAGDQGKDPAGTASIAVLPFLDLTESMDKGPFADGMTEELIDRLSKIPDLRVPGATSSFYYKDKQIPLVEIAKALHVTYVLDGSVRKSGTGSKTRVRVAARLMRADNGYVAWSESYDRPLDDILMVQDDIAGAVTKALRTSIGSGAGK